MKPIKNVCWVSVLELSQREYAHLDVCCFLVEIAVLDLPAFKHKHNPPTMLRLRATLGSSSAVQIIMVLYSAIILQSLGEDRAF